MHDIAKPIICIVGPTASGKTALAQSVALRVDAEVVSADAMQVYRGMDIGTGKIAPCERKVQHHGLDLVDPGQPYSAALFQEYARACFGEIDSRKKRIVLAGGTGFYVRAAIDEFDFPKGEQEGNPVRNKWNDFAALHGAVALWEELAKVDSKSASIIPPNDVKRVVRAFELLDEGCTYAEQRERFAHIGQSYPCVFVGLKVNPDILRERIDNRVDAMVEEGLVDEVRSLLDGGFRQGITARQAIGYKEIVAALDGDCTLEEAIHDIKVATHRYAKRQRTWFRKDGRIHWLDADELDLDALTDSVLELDSAARHAADKEDRA